MIKYIHYVVLILTFSVVSTSCSDSTANSRAEFYVRGNCEMCKERIETTIKNVNGVKNAVWDMKSKNLTIEYDSVKTNESVLNKTIAAAGHETKLEITPKEVNDALPACCQKQGE